MPNIVKIVLTKYFSGNYAHMAETFGVSPMAVRKWEASEEFPAKLGRMQQAHELTGLDYKMLTPSAFKSPEGFNSRLQKFRSAA
ncbi:hypothetical protein L3Q72_06585 [Vibrio sp. JC009]|uniref:hypothetical protein n=1 Tax=Vibrio sp. JC009 TaxID=2912314 RepID=UPI0023B1DAFD|nr:hypothetical protein [Vibrio sp. JC009]WED23056.1 hypothetical protein L3Q72_06585 [Vibrio sp. JC009]